MVFHHHIPILRHVKILECMEQVVLRRLEEICLLSLDLHGTRMHVHHPIASTVQIGIPEDLQQLLKLAHLLRELRHLEALIHNMEALNLQNIHHHLLLRLMDNNHQIL